MSLNPLPIIGLSGPIASGKDTVAGILQTHVGALPMAFAGPLRAEVSEAFGIDTIYLTRREHKEEPMAALALGRCLSVSFIDRMQVVHWHKTGEMPDLNAPRSPRQIMQWWGTEYRRVQDPFYWVKKAQGAIDYTQSLYSNRTIVVTDVRFLNEAQLVRRAGGVIWQIKRPSSTVGDASHVSEVTGEEFTPDATINNVHDIRHLQGVVLSTWAERAWSLPGVCVRMPELLQEAL